MRKTSGTTYVLVALMVGVLYFIGTRVSPTPKAPPAPPPTEQAAAPASKPLPGTEGAATAKPTDDSKAATAAAKSEALARMAQMRKMQQTSQKYQTPESKFDPNTVDVESEYWGKNKMGQGGIIAMDQKVDKAKARIAKEQAKRGGDKPRPATGITPPGP